MNFPKNHPFNGFFASLFITKAEFDSLKNNFQSQIDQYNSSIDSKIDGAIAAYLAGIKLTKKNTYDLWLKDTDTKVLNFVNNALENDYIEPSINYSLTVIGRQDSRIANPGQAYTGVTGAYVQGSITLGGEYNLVINNTLNGNNKFNYKNLVKFREGTEQNHSIPYWDGISYKYFEQLKITTVKGAEWASWLSGWNTDSAGQYRAFLQNYLSFTANGYNADYNTTQFNTNAISIVVQDMPASWTSWRTSGGDISWTKENFNNAFTVELQKYNNMQKHHLKITTYKSTESIEVNNEEYINTINVSNNQTVTGKSIHDTYKNNNSNIKAKYLWATAYWKWDNGANLDTAYHEHEWQTEQTLETKLPTIGLLGSYNANEIKLFKKVEGKTFKKTWTPTDITLGQGFPMFAANKDEKLEWTAKFDEVDCYNLVSGVKTMSKNSNEVDIYLSKSPFTDTIIPTGGNDDLIKNGLTDHWTTDSREAKIKFTMDSDSIIYMKAVPHWNDGTTSYINDSWDLYLNIDGANGQWTLEAES